MEYKSVAEAKASPGIKLALTVGIPGPWSESAKALFHVKNIAYTPVAQQGGGPNPELVEWTGHRNAPIAIVDEEPARTTAVELIQLAEKLAPSPALVPQDPEDRVKLFGLILELAGENGVAWQGRFLMVKSMINKFGEEAMADSPMVKEYGYTVEGAAIAKERVQSSLDYFADLLKGQAKEFGKGDEEVPFFIGNQLSAIDLYWACFSQIFDTMAPEQNPMPDYLRDIWADVQAEVADGGFEIDPILIRHRDFIYQEYLKLPLDF